METRTLPGSNSEPSIAESSRRKQERSKGGCWTCREGKVKCDEQRPTCRRCIRLHRVCDYAFRPRKKYTKRTEAEEDSSLLQIRFTPFTPQIIDANTTPITYIDTDGLSPNVNSSNGPENGLSRFAPRHHSGSSIALPAASPEPELPFRLSPEDQEAIHCFRFIVATAVDTKTPEFSVPSIIWSLGQGNAMVLHMMCALGARELCYRTADQGQDFENLQESALEHYGACMRLLVTTTDSMNEDPNLDCILATLWLMIVYEQKFGDGCGIGLTAHLRGAASIVQSRLRNLTDLMHWEETADRATNPIFIPLNSRLRKTPWKISPFAGRMIVWIAFLDGCAAFHGIGGDFNKYLGEIMMNSDDPVFSRIRGFSAIHRYSALMGRTTWGSSYPQEQLLEDLENRQLLYLYGELGQLRYLLAKLARAYDLKDKNVTSYADIVYRAIRDVAERYSELLDVAVDVGGGIANDCIFIRNIRFIVPFYHAITLCFLRFTGQAGLLPEQRQLALREITTLAFQAHNDEGESAMTRIAWPLLVAVLETDDVLHRNWILARFEHLKTRGENYRRAHRVLQSIFTGRQMQQRAHGFIQMVRCNDQDRFVI